MIGEPPSSRGTSHVSLHERPVTSDWSGTPGGLGAAAVEVDIADNMFSLQQLFVFFAVATQ